MQHKKKKFPKAGLYSQRKCDLSSYGLFSVAILFTAFLKSKCKPKQHFHPQDKCGSMTAAQSLSSAWLYIFPCRAFPAHPTLLSTCPHSPDTQRNSAADIRPKLLRSKTTNWRTTAKGFVVRCEQKQARKELAYTNQSITTPLFRFHVTSQNNGQNLILNVSITIKIRPTPLQKSLNLLKYIKDNLSNLRCSHLVSEHTYHLLLSHW